MVLTFEACEPVLQAEVRRILAVELRGSLSDSTTDPRTLRATVVCEQNRAELSVGDPAVGASLERTVLLSGEPVNARARLFALALAELVSALDPRGGKGHSDSQATSSPSTEDRVTALPLADTRPSVGLGVVAEVRSFPNAAFGWGAGLRMEFAVQRFAVAVDGLGHFGTAERLPDSVAVETLSLSVALGRRIELAGIDTLPTIGARVGLATLTGMTQGQARIGHTVRGAWSGPFARMSMTGSRGWLRLSAGVEAGYSLLYVRGRIPDDRDVSTGGPWLGLFIEIGTNIR